MDIITRMTADGDQTWFGGMNILRVAAPLPV